MEYTIENITDELFGQAYPLNDSYLMAIWTFQNNLRGGNLVGNAKSSDDVPEWNDDLDLWILEDGDSPFAPVEDLYDHTVKGGLNGLGHYAAPGFIGGQVLYASPDQSGNPVEIYPHISVSNHSDPANIFAAAAVGSNYKIISDPDVYRMSQIYDEDLIGEQNYFQVMRVGPWDIPAGGEIKVVTAEIVTGVDYQHSFDYSTPASYIATGKDSLLALASYLQDHIMPVRLSMGYYNVPDPPAGPDAITVAKYEGANTGNTISWSDANEALKDPDYSSPENDDLAGYKVYRSLYSVAGPWEQIGVVAKGSSEYYNASAGEYAFTDFDVDIGGFYLYAVTAYDGGHSSWPPDPSYGSVEPLETSTYTTATTDFFQTTAGRSPNLDNVRVVPNPFIIESGYYIDPARDALHFVNLPGKCTIRIFDLSGDLVKTLEKDDDTDSIKWTQLSDSYQFVESGVYIYYITSFDTESEGQKAVGKFSIIR